MTIAVKLFGSFNGSRVDQFTLRGDGGVEIDLIGYGVAVRDWRVPVAGAMRSVVLGFDTFEDYPAHSPHFGSLAGRVANRISGGGFDLDGKHYALAANEGDNTLHGGPEGLGRQVWSGEVDNAANAVRFSFSSPDGAMGFPGKVDFTATYRLHGHRLKLELTGRPDRRTPVSLVQHQYFNLGTGPDVLDHVFQLNANAFTEKIKGYILANKIEEAIAVFVHSDVDWLKGTLKDPPRPKKDELKVLELRLQKWQSKLSRAENAIRKLNRKIAYRRKKLEV